MVPFQPAVSRQRMGAVLAPAVVSNPYYVAPVTTPVVSTVIPAAPMSDALTTLLGLGWTAAGTWVGIRTGMKGSGLLSVAGWVAGIGSALAGLTILAAPLVGKRVITPLDLLR